MIAYTNDAISAVAEAIDVDARGQLRDDEERDDLENEDENRRRGSGRWARPGPG